jgi:hypothetical protein
MTRPKRIRAVEDNYYNSKLVPNSCLHFFQTERVREKFFLFANRIDIAKIESARTICLRSICARQDTHSMLFAAVKCGGGIAAD